MGKRTSMKCYSGTRVYLHILHYSNSALIILMFTCRVTLTRLCLKYYTLQFRRTREVLVLKTWFRLVCLSHDKLSLIRLDMVQLIIRLAWLLQDTSATNNIPPLRWSMATHVWHRSAPRVVRPLTSDFCLKFANFQNAQNNDLIWNKQMFSVLD